MLNQNYAVKQHSFKSFKEKCLRVATVKLHRVMTGL